MSIEDLRLRIDAIDDEILDMLDRRAHVAREIAQAKRKLALIAKLPGNERDNQLHHVRMKFVPQPGISPQGNIDLCVAA